MKKKIGILGGTFDPIHLGHLYVAECAYKQYKLDKILFMPCPKSAYKNDSSNINFRVDMIKESIKTISYAEFSDFELDSADRVYTCDTLLKFSKENINADIFFIMGTDSIFDIEKWKNPQLIFSLATVLVAPRNSVENSMSKTQYDLKNDLKNHINYLRNKYNASIELIDMEPVNISSSLLREYLNAGRDISKYVPKNVYYYLIEHQLKSMMDAPRFFHTLSVAKTARKLAEVYGENEEKAYLAGLLHDCAKCVPDDDKVLICKERGIDITQAEWSNKFLLHAKTGAVYAKEKFGIEDVNILDAIKYHTTGRENMSMLEKIIFVADYIEPLRYKQENLEYLRNLSTININKTLAFILKDTLKYLEKTAKNNIDKLTVKAYDYYSKYLEE